MKKHILCYGDSNTWGFIPGSGMRYSEEIRWPGVCRNLLDNEYEIIEDGLNGRTTVYDDPCKPYMNGKSGLGYALISQKPLDLVILMLGSNDMMFTDAIGAATGADELVRFVLNSNQIISSRQPVFPDIPKVLLISPPIFGKLVGQVGPVNRCIGKYEETLKFRALYEQVAKDRGVYFLDAAEYTSPSDADCIHLTADSHQKLGKAIAEKIKEIFT